jgi:outer membrane protein OmpA-like peptidoglycan-associated protein
MLLSGLPAAATSICTPGPFIVFFDPGSSILKREQTEILDNVIEIIGDCGMTSHLSGHADTAEDAKIVRNRLRAVQGYFAARGLFSKPANVVDEGTTNLRVATGAKVSERQNRRVEIIFTS